ncbi:MAG TPA: hypothetical protein VFK52_08125 [Nocardioidaceae bacterium]|nr:hypothetical protein [Nocardioidaceae bacterium]
MHNELRHLGRREAIVAVAVACLVLLVSWVAGRSVTEAETPAAGLSSSPTPDAVTPLDVDDQVTDDQIRSCLTRGFAPSLADVDVLYSTIQKTETGTAPVMILRNADGDLRLCDANGGDYPSQLPITYADSDTPIRHLTNGRMGWNCEGQAIEEFTVTRWFSVAPAVDRVELRFVVDGAAGRWFSAKAEDGFVHVHGWLNQQQAEAAVHLQVRVLDAQGDDVPQTELATTPQPVMACDGSDVEIL